MFRVFQAGKFVATRSTASKICTRQFTNHHGYDALVLGAYTNDVALSNTSDHISHSTRNSIVEQLSVSNFTKAGDVRLLYNVGGMKQVAVVSLGKKSEAKTDQATTLETARRAVALGVQALKKQKATNVGVDTSISAHGAAEGAVLAQFAFNKLKEKTDDEPVLRVGPFALEKVDDGLNWETGEIYGMSQNLARMLMTTPANLMTPKAFSEEVAYLLAGLENIDIIVHDKDWAVRQKMNSFLSVAQGSDEPLRFLEIHYKGASENDPLYGLVGKGITFDSGGISLKPSANMALMKGDCGGASAVAGAMYGISKLKMPVNVVAMIPLCENLPSGRATKPGDVVRAMNGKSIEVINTDAEGRLILADALYYLSSTYSPASIIDVATLTGAMDVALGQAFAGVFTNSEDMWSRLNAAGQMTSDPFWRMPLHDDYLKGMKESLVADLVNSGGRSGGSCAAAAFLQEFLADKQTPWAHIDIAGVMDASSTEGYHVKGMSGRPTRSIIEYLRGLTK
ncbi:cytosol aminopeptidase family, catalytic domain-containing protein [Fennellomyces sp. T-0311]|nr:cytosol aminopeptidase family, catalytic domain-containing protein [Fennellomyces sp. T-0311]